MSSQRQTHEPVFRTTLVIGLVITLTLLVLFFTYHRQMNTKQPARSVVAEKMPSRQVEVIDLKAWPLARLPDRPFDPRVSLPVIPALVFEGGGVRMSQLNTRLNILLGQSVIPQVHAELLPLLAEDIIRIGIMQDEHLALRFGVLTSAQARMIGIEDARTEVPVFSFSVQWFTNLENTPKDVARAMLAFYHEFVHYKDWDTSRGIDREIYSSVNPKTGESRGLSPEGCYALFEAEIRAYTAECEVGEELGIAGSNRFCAYALDERTLRHILFNEIVMKYPDPMRGYCAPYLADAAGHPNPDAYRQQF